MTYPNYPPQNPYQPAYPPGYSNPNPPGYQPPPPYQPAYQPPPQQQLARGTIDDFFGQPAASGKSLSFDGKPPGTRYTGVVVRTLTNADVQQQTDKVTRAPKFNPDGSPKLMMVIPLQMQPSPEYPDGTAAWYVKGNERAELERAMEAAGCPQGSAPEAGAIIDIVYTHERPIPGLSAQKMKTVTYTRPAATENGPAKRQQQPAAAQAQPAPVAQPAAVQHQPAMVPQSAPVAQVPANPQQQPAPQPPAQLTPEQQALLAKLTGQGG